MKIRKEGRQLKTIQIGLIGAGRIGRIHAQNLQAMPYVQVKTVMDLHPEQHIAWAESLSIANVTDQAATIFEDPEIDAVFICSSTETHVDLIKQAAHSGKHVFCEKPISFELAQSRQVIELAEQSGIQLQAGFNRRFDANFSRVRELVTQDAVGELHIIKITSRDPAPPPYEYIRTSGGLFLDMTIHDFDMARFLSGSEVSEVNVIGSVLIDPKIGELNDIDTAVITLKFENGALGIIDNSRQAVYGYDQRVEVFGSKGQVSVQNEFPNSAEISAADGVHRDKPLYFFLERYKEAYRREAEVFIEAIRSNKQVPVNGYDGYQAERIAAAAKRSWLEQRTVKLSEIMD